MRNATLSVLCLLMLGVGPTASTAAAQTDDTELPAADGEGTPEAAESEGASDVEEATPDQDEPEPEVSTPAEAASTSLASPSSELEEGDLAEDAEDAESGEGGEEEAPAPPPPLPWRSSFFSWTHQATFNSFVRDAQISYDPLYIQSFGLTPRWYVDTMSYFWFSLGLNWQLTDDDGQSAYNRDPLLSDAVVEFRHILPWEGFAFMGSVRAVLPLSKASQAAQRYLSTGLGLTIVRPVPEINLTLAYSIRYTHWFAGSNVPLVGEPQPDRCPPAPPSVGGGGATGPELDPIVCHQVAGSGGGAVTGFRDTIVHGLFATFAFDELSINLMYFFFNAYGYELAPGYINVATSEEPLRIDDGSPTHWRNFQWVALSVGYQFTPWINVALGIQNHWLVDSVYNADGSVRNPLFTPDTQVFLTATLQLDAVYTELAGAADDGLTPEQRQRRRQGLAAAPSTGGTF